MPRSSEEPAEDEKSSKSQGGMGEVYAHDVVLKSSNYKRNDGFLMKSINHPTRQCTDWNRCEAKVCCDALKRYEEKQKIHLRNSNKAKEVASLSENV